MKNYILTFLICLCAINAEDYNLKDFITQVSTNSTTNTINELKKDTISTQEKYIQYGKYNKVEIKADANYSKDYLTLGEDKTSSLEVNYGIFNLQLNYDFESKEVDRKTLGFSKSLTDLIYSEESYNKDTIRYDKLISLNEIALKTNETIVSIINQYGQIKKIEGELRIKKSTYKTTGDQYKNLKIKYNYGELSKLELDLAELRVENNRSEIDKLQRDLKDAKEELLLLADMNIESDIQLADIKNIDTLNFEDTYMREIQNLEYSKEKALLREKQEKRNNLPEINFSGNYDLDNQGYQAGISFYKAIEFIDYQKVESVNNLKVLQLELKQEKKSREKKIKNLKTRYQQLLTQYEMLKREKVYREKEILVQKNKFDEGLIDFIEYTNSSNELEKTLIDLYNIEQDICIFKYTLKYL